jgi:cobyrinic acid a,c-diamide synthase
MAALKKRGLKVQPFKCGPDYVDSEYHQIAASSKSRNLDSWLMGDDGVINTFGDNSATADISVIEGVMGMYDGPFPDSMEGSTAYIAKLLSVPVILVVDARKIAGSIAPLVKGFADFNPEVKIAGVILNKVSGAAHFELLSKALKSSNLPPPVGYMPANPQWTIDERHLGLVPLHENMEYSKWIDGLSTKIEEYINIDALLEIAKNSKPPKPVLMNNSHFREKKLKLGLAFDEAFHFYYEDNLELLEQNNFELVHFSPMNDKLLPSDVKGLYIGGGYPEVFAEKLSANKSMLEDIKNQASRGLPIYAECGGLMYLSKSIKDKTGKKHEMCGILPFDACMKDRLQSFGYKEIEMLHASLLGPAGTKLRGHEFHWSSIENINHESGAKPASVATRPFKSDDMEEKGTLINNVYASYIHAHFKSNPEIAENLYNFINLRTC